MHLCCVRCFVNTQHWGDWNVLESECTEIRTGPSLRFPMASSQSFLLAVSSRISCFCCSDSWKVSSIFTRLEGGSAAGDDSGEDAHQKKKKTEKSSLHLDRKGRCVLEENKTLADIRTFTSHPKNEVSLLTLFSPVLFSQHLVWPALSFICKSTHHYLWLSSALHYSVALHHPRWPLAALPPLPRRSPLSPWSCIVSRPVASPSRDSAYSGHRDLVWRRPLSLFC